ncbi:DNA cytosine methyltransferase [Pantoea stewartii]|uniref:DNA cytosine methyltransferase n=1 Tax=Pantoea stewartii TaxID=66269 RepID=UPI0023F6EF79|nr:DNA cytosine methyltransferase [Pantoea stewartii]MDF7787806.1 DNA cytosine methyltransferase [Pantoea stewartii]
MIYGSVCSGIEAASVAWEPLGFVPAWFSEIEKFPSAVLASHWPQVPNLGDMTRLAYQIRAGLIPAPDLLVGGTPCQAFSVAGLRAGLDDPRGQLTLAYVDLLNAIDEKRTADGKPAAICVWENVPGVLNTRDNAFGCFLAGLAGESRELESPGRKWSNAGYVLGPKRAVAWRVLDAQFFGVAQRRNRVFVVASARADFDPAKILFESDSVRRNSAPCREPKAKVAPDAGSRVKNGSHWDDRANSHPTLNQSNNAGGIGLSNQELFSQRGSGLVGGHQIAVGEVSPTLRAGNYRDNSDPVSHADMLVMAYGGGNTSGNIDVAACLTAKGQRNDFDVETFAVHGTQDPDYNRELAHTLGRNQGQENAVMAFSYKDHGADITFNLSPTLRAGNHDKSHANSGQPPAVAYAFAENSRGELRLENGDGMIAGALSTGGGKPGQGTPAVLTEPYTMAVRGRADGSTVEVRSDGTANALLTPNGGRAGIGVGAIGWGMQVRRLTPVECERLQGFPDNHTQISWRGKKPVDCPDGPRYRALGNSMAVPVMRWIGQRIKNQIQGLIA